MPQAFEPCDPGRARPADSLTSMCWPITAHVQPMMVMDQSALNRRPYQEDVRWPLSQPWRRNLTQPRCEAEGLCQGDAKLCNSKYRYGVDDVGPCPSNSSCKNSYSCPPKNQQCPNPCEEAPGCHRSTSRCFEWPQPRKSICPNEETNADFRPKRANLNVAANQPERCPTCKRVVVDMECGPLNYNY